MKFFEKYFPESRRFRIFAGIYFFLFMILFGYLFTRQVWERDDYLEKERKQGQRRIIRPGARGDVLDRENRLLIGNQANYSATLHLEVLSREIWEKKIQLRRTSQQIRESLNLRNRLSLADLVEHSLTFPHVEKRGFKISGRLSNEHDRVMVTSGGKRLTADTSSHSWSFHRRSFTHHEIQNLRILGSEESINVNVSGLFSISYLIDQDGVIIPKFKSEKKLDSWFQNWVISDENHFLEFSVNGFDHSWEARFSVVEKYLNEVNELTGRKQTLSMEEIKKHWRSKLILPLELCGDLTDNEYSILIEKLSPNSPIQIQAQPVRHYPERSLASHVLGYVGSGYEADPENLSGSDLATFQLQGRTGKAGIEKTLDPILKGKDGVDIWIVNPMGSRFERIEREPSEKGQSIQLTLDLDLQSIAEDSIDRMVNKVSNQRILPDNDWAKTLERRTNRALLGTNETEVRAELLLSAFKDAPFPLTGKQASTVAGFKGTEEDAQRLLQHLYAQGVLEKSASNPLSFFLAPPPNPPGAAVLIDVETSEIIILASKPNYDLSSLTPYISQAAYDDIQRREAWLPRAWHPGYAPASPFKLVTAITGLKNGVIDPDEKHLCEGIYKGMKCHIHPGQHGELDLRDAISQSCNVYFFRAAERITHQKLISEARWLKFDEKTPLSLPKLRDSPLVPDPEWKKKSMGVNWTLEDTFNISIGQGGLRQSPLQMACFASRLALNSLDFTPTLLSDKKAHSSQKIHLGMSEPDFNSIVEGMVRATTQGTARRCQIEGIPVAGKTGTGQWRNHNMKLNLAWFIGFAPAYDPQVAIAILVEGVIPQDQVQGGLTAAPIAKDILSAYFTKYNNKYSNN
jgi:cell division protein FtsI/penicillin-binding protein 2